MNTVKTKALDSTQLVVDLESTLSIVYECHPRTLLPEIVWWVPGRAPSTPQPYHMFHSSSITLRIFGLNVHVFS
jgi:hypothetical protein